MKRFVLIPLGEEDPQTANRKSSLRRRRLSRGLPIDDGGSKPQSVFWWQSQGRYEYEVEAVYDRHGHYVAQRYTGQTRCAG